MAGMVRLGKARHGRARFGKAGEVWRGGAGYG
jgi:hypothetical protein